ncbi:hypothetical protein, partial [Amycolatopsis sp. NPDC057786]|uniref:hypothetical protein n=1 Tax=Amycolatopsis sp. NPDC057786 TaxID=3346250 RepID=UPI00366B2967
RARSGEPRAQVIETPGCIRRNFPMHILQISQAEPLNVCEFCDCQPIATDTFLESQVFANGNATTEGVDPPLPLNRQEKTKEGI